MGRAQRIQACLNGARARGFHPRLPLTAAELAADAAACAAAGAVALHIHPRDMNGEETLDPEAVGVAVAAVRRAAPGLHVSVSTGDWIEQDDARQIWTEASKLDVNDSTLRDTLRRFGQPVPNVPVSAN